jgi:hypothetical protein
VDSVRLSPTPTGALDPGVPAASSSQMPGAKPHTSPEAISPLHDRPRLLPTVPAFGPPAWRLGRSVTPPFGRGVPHELRLRRASEAVC